MDMRYNPYISNNTIIVFLLQMWNSDLARTVETHLKKCAFQENPNRQTENPQFPTVYENAFYDVRSKWIWTIGHWRNDCLLPLRTLINPIWGLGELKLSTYMDGLL